MDTAWPYHEGQSETLLGKALKDGYRDRVKITTKLPSWMINDRRDMDSYLDAQRERLDTDCIDYYLLHALNGESWDTLKRLDVIDFIDQAKKDGCIVNAGFSFHGLAVNFKTIVDAYPWEFCQIQYALRMSGILADGEPRYASQCLECGDCLEKCPQQIPIPDFLKNIVTEMEGPEMEMRLAIAREKFQEGLKLVR